MKVAVIADTHLPRGGRRLSDRCIAELRAADAILHAGDVVGAAALADLEQLAPVTAVLGNMDDAELAARLPERTVVELRGARIGMVHDAGRAAGREERLREWFPGCDAVVYGHTHVPEVRRLGGVWLLNPGSPTERRRAPFRSLLVVEIGDGRLDPRLVDVDP